MTISAQKYIEIWNLADSVAAAAKTAHVSSRAAIQRAARYRKRGVYMKRMPGGFKKTESQDWATLSAYAEQFRREGAAHE